MTTADPRPVAGVGVVIHDGEGRILLIQRGKEPGKGLWAVPGGKVEWGEPLRSTAAREALEETGLVVDVGEVAWVGEAISSGYHIVLIDFHATVLGGNLKPASDAAEARWVTMEEARNLPLTPSMVTMLDTLEA